MARVTLHIDNPYDRQDLELGEEITIGRSDASQLVLSDQGLSRRNTTIFRDGDAVLLVDENSLNGTFLNGAKSNRPTEIRDGDEIQHRQRNQDPCSNRRRSCGRSGAGTADFCGA